LAAEGKGKNKRPKQASDRWKKSHFLVKKKKKQKMGNGSPTVSYWLGRKTQTAKKRLEKAPRDEGIRTRKEKKFVGGSGSGSPANKNSERGCRSDPWFARGRGGRSAKKTWPCTKKEWNSKRVHMKGKGRVRTGLRGDDGGGKKG